MTIIFSSDAYENIYMLKDIANQLITMMGYPITAGVIEYQNIDDALARLKAGVVTASKDTNSYDDKDDEENEKPITLATRAIPLIAMLTAAKKEKCDVTWNVKS